MNLLSFINYFLSYTYLITTLYSSKKNYCSTEIGDTHISQRLEFITSANLVLNPVSETVSCTSHIPTCYVMEAFR